MNSFSGTIPWILFDDIPDSSRIENEVFEKIQNLGIKKIMFPLSVEYRFANGIKWKLLENLKKISSVCKKYSIEPLFSFTPFHCNCDCATNIVIPKTTDAFYEFLKIADKFLPEDYYPSIGEFAPLFEERRDDYLIGAWTYNYYYFPAEYRPFASDKLFGKNPYTTEEYWKLHPLNPERSLKKYDFLAINDNVFVDFKPGSSYNGEFYRQCSEINFPLILTFDLFAYKYHGKPEIESVKTFPELASQTAYGGEGFLEYTLRECPDKLYSQVENIDIGYIMDCLD